jgi:hypothetical protein
MRDGTRSMADMEQLDPGTAFARFAFVADRGPWQRSLRGRSQRPGRRHVAAAVAAAVVATLLELAGFDALMRERFDHARTAVASMPIVVRIEALLPEPPPEPQPSRRMPVVPGTAARASIRPERGDERLRRRHEAEAEADVQGAPAESLPLLVDRDGRALLPGDRAPVAPKDGAAMFRHDSPVPYAPTRFEQAFVPRDEDLGHELVRRSTIKHTWRTPWGSRITCAASMTIVLLGGCGWGLAPRATPEELQRMRADPPPSKPEKSGALRLFGS